MGNVDKWGGYYMKLALNVIGYCGQIYVNFYYSYFVLFRMEKASPVRTKSATTSRIPRSKYVCMYQYLVTLHAQCSPHNRLYQSFLVVRGNYQLDLPVVT